MRYQLISKITAKPRMPPKTNCSYPSMKLCPRPASQHPVDAPLQV
jgi:hypothetical protein